MTVEPTLAYPALVPSANMSPPPQTLWQTLAAPSEPASDVTLSQELSRFFPVSTEKGSAAFIRHSRFKRTLRYCLQEHFRVVCGNDMGTENSFPRGEAGVGW